MTARILLALTACAWDLAIYGPAGGPAAARYETYRWLTSTGAGRAALTCVWLGLNLATAANLALLALWVRRREVLAHAGGAL